LSIRCPPWEARLSAPRSVDTSAPVLAHHEIEIKAPVEAVWALHVDVNGWTRWNPEITSASLDGPFEPGATFNWESYGFPVTSQVYEVDAGRRILWGGTAAGITGMHEWLFSPTVEGVGVVTTESFAGDPVASDAAGMQSQLDASLVAWLGRLKAAAEGRNE
jgi:uncharacterized protein YndB with AHSA1/START domain